MCVIGGVRKRRIRPAAERGRVPCRGSLVPVPIKGAQETKIAPDAVMDARGSRRARRGL